MVIYMKDWGEFLLTRSIEKKVRNTIIKKLSNTDFIELNFEGVKNATQAFLDESIAKLLFVISLADFTKKIKFKNTNHGIKTGIKFAVSERINKLYLK